tara:strand:+ start:897 stop:1085 length:189 start_codon:yes stop_codon:yes gene_type:complete
MALNLDFQIGEKVVWTVGKIKTTGCFLEDNNDGTCDVVTHYVNGRLSNRIITVQKSILKLDI